ncbi:MAG: pyrroline-5-carboxylate reductase [Actinomycetota bacterium]|nr:pyrroline-5-carboxylate reductase [Actinomycetota bacterium]
MRTIENQSYGLIGAGVMGEALIETLLKAGARGKQISFLEKRENRATEIAAKFGIELKSLDRLLSESDLIFLVVKPQDLEGVLQEMKQLIGPEHLIISLAAGKKSSFIEKVLKTNNPVIRVMPNTPLLIGKGISALSMGKFAKSEDGDFLNKILSFGGSVIILDEELQDAVTAMSGSGPAYFFAFIESMVTAGKKLGLNHEDAMVLAKATIEGAAAMLKQPGADPKILRENVTSPAGTTAAALQVFKDRELDKIIEEAMKAARDRSLELG